MSKREEFEQFKEDVAQLFQTNAQCLTARWWNPFKLNYIEPTPGQKITTRRSRITFSKHPDDDAISAGVLLGGLLWGGTCSVYGSKQFQIKIAAYGRVYGMKVRTRAKMSAADEKKIMELANQIAHKASKVPKVGTLRRLQQTAPQFL